jgi:hypothetical protein
MTKFKWLPSEPTDEMVDAAMSSLSLSMPEIQVKQIYSLLWKTAPEVEQEPVGLFGCRDGEYRHILEPDDAGDYEELVELYTHPQPKREPVTDKQISDLYKSLPLDTREDVCSFSFKLGFKKAMELLNA